MNNFGTNYWGIYGSIAIGGKENLFIKSNVTDIDGCIEDLTEHAVKLKNFRDGKFAVSGTNCISIGTCYASSEASLFVN